MRYALLILALAATSAQAETAADRFAPKRGLNLEIRVEWLLVGDMLADPAFLTPYPDWRRHLTPERIATLAADGFDFVRMPLDPTPLLALGPSEKQDHPLTDIQDNVRMLQAEDPAATPAALSALIAQYRRTPDDFTAQAVARAAMRADAHVIPHCCLLLGEFGAVVEDTSREMLPWVCTALGRTGCSPPAPWHGPAPPPALPSIYTIL